MPEPDTNILNSLFYTLSPAFFIQNTSIFLMPISSNYIRVHIIIATQCRSQTFDRGGKAKGAIENILILRRICEYIRKFLIKYF